MSSKRITVFASGSGTNFKVLHRAALKGDIPAVITALVSDKPGCGAVEYARNNGIRTHVLANDEAGDTAAGAARLTKVFDREKPDLIVLAGYLKKIPESIVDRYPEKIINIHPSLLPKYGGKGWYGMRVHRAVIENNDSETGCTIHYVNNRFDEGPVIARKKIPVSPGDTPESLAKKVQKQEHVLYPEVVQKLLK